MHKLFDLATLWEYLPLERRNPTEIVKARSQFGTHLAIQFL